MKNFTLLAFMLICSFAGYSQLALEDFEGAVWPPDQWSIYDFQGPQQQWTLGSTTDGVPVHSPTHSAYMQKENVATGSTTEDFLVTKPFTVPTNPQLRFWSVTTIPGNQLNTYKVMLLPPGGNPAQSSDYVLLQSYSENDINPIAEEWNLITVNNAAFANYVGQQVRLAFVMMGDNGDRWAIDDVEVVTQCMIPTGLTANNISQTGATLSWTSPSAAPSWEVEVVAQSAPPTGTGVTVSSSTYTLTGLTSDTCYKFYVRAKCSTTNESPWAGPFNFCTVAPGANCNAPLTIGALPYTHTSNTNLYGNDYAGSPGTSCGTTNFYLGGDDVVYAYTPTQNQVITVNLTNLTDTYAGMFVYTSCADIGVNCYQGAFNQSSTDNLAIEQMSVTAGTTYYILISTWPTPNSVGYTLNIQVENCAKPTNLTATGATTSSINLAWQEAATATSWEYVVQPVGTGVPAGSGTATTTTTVPVAGLPASTAFEVYVRSDCGNGTFSSWTGPVVFNTLCEALDVPFFEGFNTGSPTEFCWTVLDVNADGDAWDMNNDFNPFEGNEAAAINTDFNSGANNDWLISPTLNLTGNQRLRYRYRVESEFEPNDFEVLLSTTGTDAADFTQVLVPMASYSNTNYVEVIHNMPGVTGPVNIAWHVPEGGLDGWRLYIDNVFVENIPTCPDPLNLAASNVDEDGATLSWTPGFNETAWDIVVQPQGTGIPTGAGVPVPGTSPTFNATGLNPSTNYEYYVRANCAVNDQSNWVGPFLFMTTQVPGTLTYIDGFETTPTEWSLSNGTQTNQWVVGTAISNSGTHSLYITNDGGISNAYTDNAFSVVHAYRDVLMPNPVDQISVSFDWRAQAENCCDYLKVWAVPASFVPVPGEEIPNNGTNKLLSGNLNYSLIWTTENYVMDASAFGGQVLRIVFEWRNDGSLAGPSPAPAAVDNVDIRVITCPSPSDLVVGNIGLYDATVSWTGPSSVTPTYDYYYSTSNVAPTETTTPNGNVSTGTTTNLTGLNASSVYYVWVRTNCGTTDGNSFWVGPLEFITLPLCPEPTNVEISCLSSEAGNMTWEAGGTETSWEVAIVENGAPMPTTGIIVDEMIYYAMNLEPETAYTFYIRAVCPDNTGVGAWVTANFTTPTTSVQDANAFCANEEAITFQNTSGNAVQSYGPVACLGSTPNPVWYYLQIEDPGDFNFRLVQNTNIDENGVPVGQGLDVDFVAFGPFTSLNEACGDIVLEPCNGCPNNTGNPNYYPVGNIVDCSYDAAFIENFTIHNAQSGEIYAVLITNFSSQPGEIQLEMLDSSTGTTNCNILYQVALGPDQTFCGQTDTTLTATVTTPGNGQTPTYEWSKDGVVFTPEVVNTGDLTQTIHVTGSGVYSVVITVPNSINTEPITDAVTVTFGPAVNAVTPAQYAVCDDENNDGIGEFNLPSLNSEILGNMAAADFTVSYFTTEANATANANAIASPATFNNTTANTQTIYAAVRSNAVPTCFDIVPVELVVKPLPVTTMPVSHTACEGGQVTITGTATNYNTADAAFAWFLNGAPISDEATNTITVSESGIYTLQVTLNGCTNNAETEVIITPAPAFNLGGPYAVCTPNSATITVSAENFNAADATYTWTLDGNAIADNTASITPASFGMYEVTVTVNGCTSVKSIAVTENTTGVTFAFLDGCEDNIYSLEVIDIDDSFDPETAVFTWTGPAEFENPAPNVLGLMSIEPTVAGVYTVTFVTPDGCIGTNEYNVPSTSCYIQRGISPGDGVNNDFFDLTALDVKQLSIFNRYGQEVYTKSNYTREWGGQDKSGNELPTGTYFYSIERENGETKTGWVYINRLN